MTEGLFGGRFRTVRQLGAGGFGSVHLATDTQLGLEVALKILGRDVLSDPDQARRFQREARVVAKLQHPNIVRVIDHGVDRDQPWIAFEYLTGMPLSERLQREPLGVAETLRIGSEIAEALAVAHAEGIHHRDVKPANVLTDRSGNSKLADFGVALWTSARTIQTQAGVVLGTPDYMPPEYIRGGPFLAQGDLYALGVMLWEMLAGRTPFRGASLPELLAAHLHTAPPCVGQVVPGVPPALDQLILQLLEKEPGKRPSSAKAVARALVAIEPPGGEPLERRTGKVSRAVRPSSGTRVSSAVDRPSTRPSKPTPEEGIEAPSFWSRRAVGVAVAALVASVALVSAVQRDPPGPVVAGTAVREASARPSDGVLPSPLAAALARLDTEHEELEAAEEAAASANAWQVTPAPATRRTEFRIRRTRYAGHVLDALDLAATGDGTQTGWVGLAEHFILATNAMIGLAPDTGARAVLDRLQHAVLRHKAPLRGVLDLLSRRTTLVDDTRPEEFVERCILALDAATLDLKTGADPAEEDILQFRSMMLHEASVDAVRGFNMLFVAQDSGPRLDAVVTRVMKELLAVMPLAQELARHRSASSPPLVACSLNCLNASLNVLECDPYGANDRRQIVRHTAMWLDLLARAGTLPSTQRSKRLDHLLARLLKRLPEMARWPAYQRLYHTLAAKRAASPHPGLPR